MCFLIVLTYSILIYNSENNKNKEKLLTCTVSVLKLNDIENLAVLHNYKGTVRSN